MSLRKLGKLGSLSEEQTSAVGVYSDLGCCRKAVKEKIEPNTQARLKVNGSIFYFNNSQSYPKSASARKRNKVSHKVFARPAFFKKRAVLRSLLYLPVVAVFAVFDADADSGEAVADLV